MSQIMATARLIDRTCQEWFHEAERTYTEKHQGCPWCGGSHRVFCQRRESTIIFYCQGCDFQVSHDPHCHRFQMTPGQLECADVVPETMFGSTKTMSS